MEFDRIYVIGLGYVGLPLAINAAKSGYFVTGFDIDRQKISELQEGVLQSSDLKKSDLLQLQASGNLKFLNFIPKQLNPAIFIIAVPTPLDLQRNPDLSMLQSACEIISSAISDRSLVINESTSYVGTLRNLIKPTIEKLSAVKNISYAVAPERIDPGNTKWGMHNTPRIISGLDDLSTKQAVNFYSEFAGKIHTVSKPEVAEAAKLFENTFRQVNIALVNELSIVADLMDFSTHETIEAAATKPFGFMPFFPSIGVGGHCIPVDPSYLAFSAENAGVEAKFINLANEVNLSMPALVTGRIKSHLNGDLKGKRIQIAGITYKPDIPDLRESPALNLIKELKIAGAVISWHDPFVKDYEGQQSVALTSEVDLGLIVTPHSQIDFSIWKNAHLKVLDLSANSNDYGWPKFL